MEKIVKIIISGKVQGVGYRDWTRKQAGKLGLHGWVRNLGDGTVEALFYGEENQVEQILEKCKFGPPGALVGKIKIIKTDEQDRKIEPVFQKKPTLL